MVTNAEVQERLAEIRKHDGYVTREDVKKNVWDASQRAKSFTDMATVCKNCSGGDLEFNFSLPTNARRVQNSITREHLGWPLAGDEIIPKVEAALNDVPMRSVATIERRPAAINHVVPFIDGTANEAATLVADSQSSNLIDAKFGRVTIAEQTFASGFFSISRALMEDCPFLFSTLVDELARVIARGQNRVYTLGDTSGVGGIVSEAFPVNAAQPGSLSIDDLLNLVSEVPDEYAKYGAWMMSKATWLSCRSLKDGSARPLWDASGCGAFPVVFNKHMGSVAVGARPILFGQLSKYTIVDTAPISANAAAAVRIQRLVERRAEFYEDQWIAYAYGGGALVDAGSHPVVALVT